MVIYMDRYKSTAAKVSHHAMPAMYGEEVMNANWNPEVVGLMYAAAQAGLSPELPEDLSQIDVRTFLDRVYALASQI